MRHICEYDALFADIGHIWRYDALFWGMARYWGIWRIVLGFGALSGDMARCPRIWDNKRVTWVCVQNLAVIFVGLNRADLRNFTPAHLPRARARGISKAAIL